MTKTPVRTSGIRSRTHVHRSTRIAGSRDSPSRVSRPSRCVGRMHPRRGESPDLPTNEVGDSGVQSIALGTGGQDHRSVGPLRWSRGLRLGPDLGGSSPDLRESWVGDGPPLWLTDVVTGSRRNRRTHGVLRAGLARQDTRTGSLASRQMSAPFSRRVGVQRSRCRRSLERSSRSWRSPRRTPILRRARWRRGRRVRTRMSAGCRAPWPWDF